MRGRRLAVALVASVLVVLSSPWIGEMRDWLRHGFPSRFLLLLNGGLAAVAAGTLALVVRRIGRGPLWRYGALVLGIGIAAIWMVTERSPSAESNAVERFHFFEYGLLTWLFYRAVGGATDPRTGARAGATPDVSLLVIPALAGLIVGTADEALQWYVPSRVGEWRDVFLNLVAIGTGLLVSAALRPPGRLVWRVTAAARRRICLVAAAAAVVLAAFIHAAHLGHRIEDPAIGVFQSRYTASELRAASETRAQQWRLAPPPLRVPRLSREDHYLFEAVRHVQARNSAWPADPLRAWGENAILETYFAPSLDTPTSVLPAPSRWGSAHRGDAQTRVQGLPPSPFRSDVLASYIFVWSPVALWSITLLLAAVSTAVALWPQARIR
jgi:hypothetical protein